MAGAMVSVWLEMITHPSSISRCAALFSASHALKGLYASLALTPLHAICSEIVEIARAGSTEGVAERLERLEKMHREVLEMTKQQETDQ